MTGKRECFILGCVSILLSFSGAFVYLSTNFRVLNIPFMFVLTSLYGGAYPFPEINLAVDILRVPQIDYLLSAVLFSAGVGIILKKKWGAVLSRAFALVMIIIWAGFSCVIVVTYLNDFFSFNIYLFFKGLLYTGVWLFLLNAVLALAYPAVLLVFFNRAGIRNLLSR